MNEILLKPMMNYNIEPGDATRYRFSFFQTNGVQSLFMCGGFCEGVFLTIQMAGGSGCGIIPMDSLVEFHRNPCPETISYIREQGFNQVYIYTLVAVLHAVAVLVENDQNVAEAAKAMLKAKEFDYSDLI